MDKEHTFESSSYWEDFSPGKNVPLVLMRNAQPDIALEVTTLPNRPINLPILWRAVRNTADAAALGTKTDLPTVTGDAKDSRKATLSANEKGSFHIRPYIDCNGLPEYSPGEPSIPLNLVLANVTLVADNSAVNAANLSSTVAAPDFQISNGKFPASNAWGIATGTAATNAGGVTGAGITMELVADVTGGAADGKLGLDQVFGGLVNNLEGNGIAATYTVAGAHPATFIVTNLYVMDTRAASGHYARRPVVSAPPRRSQAVSLARSG